MYSVHAAHWPDDSVRIMKCPQIYGHTKTHQLVTEPSGMGGKDCAHPYSTIIASKHKSAINLRNLCHIDVLCLFFLRAFDKGFKNIACTLLMRSEILACTMDCFAFFGKTLERKSYIQFDKHFIICNGCLFVKSCIF